MLSLHALTLCLRISSKIDIPLSYLRMIGARGFEPSRWFRFHNALVENRSDDPLDSYLYEFLDSQREEQLSIATIRSRRAVVSDLFSWMRSRGMPLSEFTAADVEGYMEGKRAAGCKPRTIAGICNCLRSFFRYAELQGWVGTVIAHDIHGPRIPGLQPPRRGPHGRMSGVCCNPRTRGPPTLRVR